MRIRGINLKVSFLWLTNLRGKTSEKQEMLVLVSTFVRLCRADTVSVSKCVQRCIQSRKLGPTICRLSQKMAAGLDLVTSYPVKLLSVRHTSLILKNGSSLQQHSLLGPTGSIYQYVTSVETESPALC